MIYSFTIFDMKVYLHQIGYEPRLLFLLLQEQGEISRSNFMVPHYVQVLILKGRGTLIDESNGEHFELRPGSLIQRRPGKAVTQQFDSPDGQQLFFLSPPHMYDLIVASLGEQPACIQVADAAALRRQWIDFASIWSEKSYEQTVLALPPILAAGLCSGMIHQDWLQQARELLTGSFLSPEKVAAKLGMSYVSFRTRFRHEEGMPPAAFRRAHLLARASNLLLETDLSISEIADTLSYNDIFSFSRQFKHVYDLSPQQWRLHNRNTDTA
ncbi:MAG: helix-turn-helix domain-containing protein [Verrucomicrobia bacterium]|nr:helix-turn-helix domain-containing protein [Verrucomicrobiota bacterium]